VSFATTLREVYHLALAVSPSATADGQQSTYVGKDADGRPCGWTLRVGQAFAARTREKARELRAGVVLGGRPGNKDECEKWVRAAVVVLSRVAYERGVDPFSGVDIPATELNAEHPVYRRAQTGLV
jgi:hypothetical protein